MVLQNFTSADQLIKEREQEQFNVERQVWEQHCEQLHQEVSNLTSLCNGLLRDQQLLVSTIINRGAGTSPSPNAGLHNFPGRVSGLGKLKTKAYFLCSMYLKHSVGKTNRFLYFHGGLLI